MLSLRSVLLVLTSLALAGPGNHAHPPQTTAPAPSAPPVWDTQPDTWAATDALGRKLPNYDQVGPPRKDRYVGMFYFLWHSSYIGGPYDVTKILQQDPAAMTKPDSKLWGGVNFPHHWGESLFGYYQADDEYVIRKNAQMLADAGVDVIIFDVTNNITYKPVYMKLLQVYSQIRAAGGRTPQVAFLCPFWDPNKVVHELFVDLYGPGLYKDLWFQWHGKPLILADPTRLGDFDRDAVRSAPWDVDAGKSLGEGFVAPRQFKTVGAQVATYAKTNAAVTLSLYRDGPSGRRLTSKRCENISDNGWISLTFDRPLEPGNYYLELSNPKGRVAWWSNTGKPQFSPQIYVNGRQETGALMLELSTAMESGVLLEDFFTFRSPQPSYFEGPTKPDMWSWLEVYPQHVFTSSTGKKEQMSVGVAQNAVDNRLGSMSEIGAHGRNWHNGDNDESPGAVNKGLNFQEQAERALKEDPEFVFITGWNEWIAGRFPEFNSITLPVMFVDEFNEEFSRDIEPMLGGHGDDYYYQLVSFIRRYKGVRPPPEAGPSKTIEIDGDFRQWNDVKPEFRDDVGDAAHRDHDAWGGFTRYVNKTGRNDFVVLKVARDKQDVYFYARTKDPISPYSDLHWMMLFINVGPDTVPNWLGYQYVLNRSPADASSCTLEQSSGGWNWTTKASVRYRVSGNEMQIAIPRDVLGLSDLTKPIQVEFKWMDNMQHEGDVTDFDLYGDAAPNGRFNYQFREKSTTH